LVRKVEGGLSWSSGSGDGTPPPTLPILRWPTLCVNGPCMSLQSATLHAVGALGFTNLGTTLAISGLDGPATGALALAAVFGVLMFQGFRRIDR